MAIPVAARLDDNMTRKHENAANSGFSAHSTNGGSDSSSHGSFFFFFDGLWSDQCILSAFRFPQHYYIDGIQFTIGTVTLQYPSRYSMRALFIGSLLTRSYIRIYRGRISCTVQ